MADAAQAKKRKLDDLLAGGIPSEDLTGARPDFAVGRALQQKTNALQQAYEALQADSTVSGEQLQGLLKQIDTDSRSLESLFRNPTGDNYLQALYLLTKLLPPTKRNAINDYIQLQRSQTDPWYAKFVDSNTSYKKAYFGKRNDEIVQFIMWVAKQHVKDCFLNYDARGGLSQTTLTLKHANYVKYCKDVYPFVTSGAVLGTDPQANTLLFALIGDIAIDLLYNVSLSCSIYPQGTALRNCIKYLSRNARLPQVQADVEPDKQSPALYILQVFTKDYSSELAGDEASQAEYIKRVQSAYDMRPTTNLSVRLRLA